MQRRPALMIHRIGAFRQQQVDHVRMTVVGSDGQRGFAATLTASSFALRAKQRLHQFDMAGTRRDDEQVSPRGSTELTSSPRSTSAATVDASPVTGSLHQVVVGGAERAVVAAMQAAKISARSASCRLLQASGQPRGVAEQPEEVVGRDLRDLFHRHVANAGQFGCHMRHEGRFVHLAAIRHGRQIGRIGLDEQSRVPEWLFATSRSACAFLNVTMPEKEMQKPMSIDASATSSDSVKQCMTPPTSWRALRA
jgi:hypothetical protein